jgi:hypothetical protein
MKIKKSNLDNLKIIFKEYLNKKLKNKTIFNKGLIINNDNILYNYIKNKLLDDIFNEYKLIYIICNDYLNIYCGIKYFDKFIIFTDNILYNYYRNIIIDNDLLFNYLYRIIKNDLFYHNINDIEYYFKIDCNMIKFSENIKIINSHKQFNTISLPIYFDNCNNKINIFEFSCNLISLKHINNFALIIILN